MIDNPPVMVSTTRLLKASNFAKRGFADTLGGWSFSAAPTSGGETRVGAEEEKDDEASKEPTGSPIELSSTSADDEESVFPQLPLGIYDLLLAKDDKDTASRR